MDFHAWFSQRVKQDDFRYRTQQEIANLLGISLNTYSQWLHGHAKPRNNYLKKITLVFGIELRDLFQMLNN